MTKFSTSGFVHPVYCSSHRVEKTRAEREKRQSEREKESATNGRTENERAKTRTGKRNTLAVRVVGEEKISKIFKTQNNKTCVYTCKRKNF